MKDIDEAEEVDTDDNEDINIDVEKDIDIDDVKKQNLILKLDSDICSW